MGKRSDDTAFGMASAYDLIGGTSESQSAGKPGALQTLSDFGGGSGALRVNPFDHNPPVRSKTSSPFVVRIRLRPTKGELVLDRTGGL